MDPFIMIGARALCGHKSVAIIDYGAAAAADAAVARLHIIRHRFGAHGIR